MASTIIPTGLSIARSGDRFTLSWKIGDKDYEGGQQFSSAFGVAGRRDSWGAAVKLGPKVTSRAITVNRANYYPNKGKPKLLAVKMRIRGKRKAYKTTKKVKKKKKTVTVNPDWSALATKTFTINVPVAPTLTAELDETLTNRTKFKYSVTVSASTSQMFTDMVFQTMLVKDCNVTDGSKLTWKDTGTNSWQEGVKAGTGEMVITEDTTTLASGSYTRWFRICSRGPAGNSVWRYAKHVYARSQQAKIQGEPQVSETEENGLAIRVDWIVESPASAPIDRTTAQYCMVVPNAGMTCPNGASWSDANISADTGGTDSAVVTVDDQLDDDQCLFVRINTKHDSYTTYGRPTLALAGDVKSPSALSVPTDNATHRATVTATNKSDIPDAFLEVLYRASSDASEDLVVGIIPPGAGSVTVQCPDWSEEDAVAFGVRAAVGDYSIIEREDGVSAYAVVEKMKSAITLWEGGSVPKAPAGVRVATTDTPGTVMVNWDWSWGDADGAEISWADHEDAWESTDEPSSYKISNLHASKWYVSGLETGQRWYVRVRLLKSIDDNKATYGPWSDIQEIDLSSAPRVPSLVLSEGVITKGGTLVASWAYAAEDGTTQMYADICEATFSETGIEYGTIIAHTETAQRIELRASELEWQAGETHLLCVRVMSSAGKLSDSWSEPVAVTVAEPLVATIADSSLVEKTVIEDEEQRQTLSLTEMPLSVTTQGAGEGGETIVAIERVGDYHMARPDETKYDGFDGETIAKVETIGDGAIEIDTSDLILALDDGASYKVVVTIKDGLGQTASAEQEFEVHWDHQAVIPEAAVRVDQENYAAIIDLLVPEGAIGTDRCDIYRLSMDRPELIVRDGIPGQTYVDPYPTIGSVGGHRVVFKTENGDYITEDNMPAWVDLGVEEDDTLDINDNIIDFDGERVGFTYNVDLSSKWKKDFENTSYLNGAIQGDWNPGVQKETSINAIALAEDEDAVRAFRRLAEYTGQCHVRTLDGSSFTADVQVQMDMKSSEAHKLAAFSLAITRVDPERLDGIPFEEWE